MSTAHRYPRWSAWRTLTLTLGLGLSLGLSLSLSLTPPNPNLTPDQVRLEDDALPLTQRGDNKLLVPAVVGGINPNPNPNPKPKPIPTPNLKPDHWP